ncbi:MAG TPA: ABC transporter substrate-binding protein [Micromonosporaceae bacterium]
MRLLRRWFATIPARAGRPLFALAVVATLAAGCGKSAEPLTDPLKPQPDTVRLYGVDGNMLNSVGALVKDFPQGLNGMKGTAPFTRLPQTFKDRLRTVNPKLVDDLYAGESYDAVVISALAAAIAKTTTPSAIAAQINGVTTGGVACDGPKACLALIAAGKDIAYKGVSLSVGGFTDAGEPSASTYGIFRFAAQNTLAENLTEFVPAGDPQTASQQRPPTPGRSAGGQALKIGALLPKSGQLAGAGPPMFAGAALAVRELNAAGGVLGRPIDYLEADDGTDSAKAEAAAKQLISKGVHVIIGAGGSGISKAILPTVVQAGVILFSPCNTAAELTNVDDSGLYFRTAPPDGLQAQALTDIIMRDGVRRVFMIARDDAYGRPFLDAIRENLLGAGLVAGDIKATLYGTEGTPDFSDLGAEVKEFAPDGVVIIGYDESADALSALLKAGLKSRPN